MSWPQRVLWVLGLAACSGGEHKGTQHSESMDSARDSGHESDTDTDTDTDTDSDIDSDTGESWRSLLYPSDWAPGLSIPQEDGGPDAQLQDFSYAGYLAGEADLPEPALTAVVSVLDHGADSTGSTDSTAAVQAAIDLTSVDGGGTVYLPAGIYRIDGLLSIQASNVIIAGDGPEATFLSLTRSSTMSDTANIHFVGTQDVGPSIQIASDLAAGQTVIPLTDVDALNPGDSVGIGTVISAAFITEHGMDGFWTFADGERRTLFRRTLVAVDSDSSPPTVTIDVPTRYPLKTRDLSDIRLETGAISGCGIANLSVSTAVDWDAAWDADRSHAIEFEAVEDCWMSGVHSWAGPAGDGIHHLQSGGVIVNASRRVTIANSRLENAQNRGGGGNGYLFEVRQSNEVLIRDSVAMNGRHNFIQNWDFGTSGCVFLRTHSEGGEAWGDQTGSFTPPGMSEFHHALAMGNLIDSSTAEDGWAAVNRLVWSSGAGHTATETVFWNTRGGGSLTSLQFGRGYVIGTQDLDVRTVVTEVLDSVGTAPEDWVEGLGQATTLVPQSLYEDQLSRRTLSP